ncbi:hypothetical protein [Streptomyces rubrogriseus]|uniref:hypothetical protein n=1 Tax=Streptomyces rubrogriseus TaxID=194673 RepID=UPI0037D79FFD
MNPSRNAVSRTLLAPTGAALPARGGRPALTSDPVAGRPPGRLSHRAAGTVPLDRVGLAGLRDRARPGSGSAPCPVRPRTPALAG